MQNDLYAFFLHYTIMHICMAHLDEYQSLIQLLIGSVVFVLLFQKEDFLSKVRETIGDTTSPKNYETVDSNEWERRLNTLRRSIMLILGVYGCMILYYCANFDTINYNITLQNNEEFPVIDLFPSLSGIALLSFIVTIFQVIAFSKPFCLMQGKKTHILRAGFLISMVIVFLVLICIIPYNRIDDYNFSSFMGRETWEKSGKQAWETFVISWVLINLLSWIPVYLHINNGVIRNSNQLKTDNNIINQFGIEGRLKTVSQMSKDKIGLYGKCYLFKRAKEELKKENQYFDKNVILYFQRVNEDTSFQTSLVKKKEELNKRFTESLTNAIDESGFSHRKKEKLKSLIIKEPKFSSGSIVTLIENDKDKVLRKPANRLCRFGIYKEVDKEVQQTGWKNITLWINRFFQVKSDTKKSRTEEE